MWVITLKRSHHFWAVAAWIAHRVEEPALSLTVARCRLEAVWRRMWLLQPHSSSCDFSFKTLERREGRKIGTRNLHESRTGGKNKRNKVLKLMHAAFSFFLVWCLDFTFGSAFATSSPWNYKVLSDIFVKIELFTFSFSVAIYLHYVMCFVHWGSLLFLCLKETCSPYTFSYMECKNFEAQYLKTAQNADRTL